MKNILLTLTNDKRTRRQKLRYLKKNDPKLWEQIVSMTSFLPESASAPQRIWHIMNDIYEIQICQVTGEKVNWISYDYGYCKHKDFTTSRKVVGDKVRTTVKEQGHWRKDEEKAKKANKTFTEGFENGNHKPWSERNRDSKEYAKKARKTCLEKYGVPNALVLPSTLEAAFNKRIEKGLITPLELKPEKEIYYWWVAEFTRQSWVNNYDDINPKGVERGDEWVVDHIYSRHWGFQNNIPPYIIGHWTNLQMLTRKENSSKGPRCDKTLDQLFEDFFSRVIG